MDSVLFFIWSVVWPVAFILGIRFFPKILTATVEKRLDRHHSEKLASFTTGLKAKYSTLQTSVDYLSMQQNAMSSHIISSVRTLWDNVLTLQDSFAHLLVYDSFLTVETIQAAYAEGKAGEFFKDYHDFNNAVEKMRQFNDVGLEETRLFVGEHLWLQFFAIRGVYGRYIMLTHQSLQDNRYRDWRDDELMMKNLNNCLEP